MGLLSKRSLRSGLMLPLAALLALACEFSTSSGPQYPAGQQYPPGQAPPPPGAPAGGPQAQPGVGQAAPPAPGAVPQPVPQGNAVLDPINNVDIVWLRGRAQSLYQELAAALPPRAAARIAGVPLAIDDTPGDVNAFAACTESGKSLMAITDGLLDISAHLAQCKANDELFGTRKTDEYIAFIAQNQRPGQPIVRPALSFFDPQQKLDGRKVQRQGQLLDEQLGFVLAHEMAHHYLGHLPCTAGNVTASEVGAVLTNVVPAFNQVNETGADTAGVHNILNIGARRPGYHLTEGGALLTMQFFSGMDASSPIDMFDFERSHPPPVVRIPIINQTANAWRFTGGAPLPWVG